MPESTLQPYAFGNVAVTFLKSREDANAFLSAKRLFLVPVDHSTQVTRYGALTLGFAHSCNW